MGQVSEHGFVKRIVVVDSVEYKYQVYIPDDYDASRSWPVILSLHGSGEKGTDGVKQTTVGLGRAVNLYPDSYPAIVVFPQTPGIWHDLGSKIALATLDKTIAEFNIDESRIYLTGLSMGGNGAWYVGYHHPERFAAMVVVCGWVSQRDGESRSYPPVISGHDEDIFEAVAERLSDMPLWIFHGDKDAVVSVSESRNMTAALQRVGADVRYIEFVDVHHNAWDPAYSYGAMTDWLFEQSSVE